MTPHSAHLSITAIMPAFNAVETLHQTLAALLEMVRVGSIEELILVDDGSDDGTSALATTLGCRVVESGGTRLGPGQARNAGASAAAGEVLWFVDADVIAHPDAPRRIRHALQEPGVVATFGSYDANPPAPGFFSQYKNLIHHHYHQIGQHEAGTFWAGCGAVRRDAFLAAGGFDVARFPEPSIEDIELGYRLRARGGRIVLCPELQGTHLKVWTLRSLIETDIRRRALPWSRLLLSGDGPRNDLNVSIAEQLRAVIACATVGLLLGALSGVLPWTLVACSAALAAAANLDLLVRLASRNGWRFGLTAIVMHQVYYCYSLAVYAWCWIEARTRPRSDRRSVSQSRS